MNRLDSISQLKLAAIDLDGTLLSHEGKISPDNAQAVRRLQDAGVEVVLASGRHFLNMQRYAESLPGVNWLVSCQGGEISDSARKTVLTREFLDLKTANAALDLGHELGFASLVYSVDGVLTDAEGNSGLDFYADLAGRAAQKIGRAALLADPIFKILWLGHPPQIEAAMTHALNMNTPIEAVRTHQRIIEFMPAGVTKATGLKKIAARLDIQASEVVAFGDGDNDVPMFEWAGVSVAMSHGWPSAIKKAKHSSPPGSPDTAFARSVDFLFTHNYNTAPVPHPVSTSSPSPFELGALAS